MPMQIMCVRPDAPPDPTPVTGVSQEIADCLLETRIRRKLLGLLGRAACNIGVVASEGMVVLSGFVPATLHELRALRITRGVTGVEEVHDLMNVRPGQPGRGAGHESREAPAVATQE